MDRAEIRALPFVERTRIVRFTNHYDPSNFIHRFSATLTDGQTLNLRFTSEEVEDEMRSSGGLQGVVWCIFMNRRLRSNIVERVTIPREGDDIVVLHLRGDLQMKVPEKELFDDATLATLVLMGAANAHA